MAYVKGKRTEEIIPYDEALESKKPILKEGRGKEAQERILSKGTIYLENNLRERKITGSYYTPDYVVKYIISETVGPVLRQKLEALRPLFREAEQMLQAEKGKAEGRRKQRLTALEVTPEQLTYEHYKESLVYAFFQLKILDPAMGSGHFLVEAVDYVTDQMAKFLSAFKWSPIVYELSETRRSIQREIEEAGMSIDVAKLTDLNLLKRRVVKSCIYGIDLNPMAVELAKVSLWLDCFTLGAPLSFLDHHMKCGNALLGRSILDAQQTLVSGVFSYEMADLLSATDLMRKVGEYADITAQEVGISRAMYKEANQRLLPHKRLLHVLLSEVFGNKGATQTLRICTKELLAGEYNSLNEVDQKAITLALALAETKHFLHWDLEFPEVYFDQTGRMIHGGFDAIIGNPPYIRQEELKADKGAFKEIYRVYHSIADLYTYFIEQGHTQLRPQGRFGMITANKFMRANYGASLRLFLTSQIKLERLIDFGDLPVFADATAYPIILLSSQGQRHGEHIEYTHPTTLPDDTLSEPFHVQANPMPESAFSGITWSLTSTPMQTVLQKLGIKSIPLKSYTPHQIRRGVLTGFNEAFIIDESTRNRLVGDDPKSQEIIKPFVIGEDVKRYRVNFEQRYLIFTRRGIDITKYPAIQGHLSLYREDLAPKPLDWDSNRNGIWQGRKSGSYEWYEIQDNIAYYADFEKPKIMWPIIAKSNQFAFDKTGAFSNDKTFIIPTDDLYILAVLNSSLMFQFLCTQLSPLRGGFWEYRAQTLENVPIRHIPSTTPQEVLSKMLAEMQGVYESLSDGFELHLLDLIKQHFSNNSEQVDIIAELLRYLTKSMLLLNNEREVEKQTFLKWLSSALQIQPDKGDLKGIDLFVDKARLLNYSGDYQQPKTHLRWEDLFSLLMKNKRRLGISLQSAPFIDLLRAKYAGSLEKLIILQEHLLKTDKLIDQIVYRLYGLTDEEITFVENESVESQVDQNIPSLLLPQL
jgi:hypothetical protein